MEKKYLKEFYENQTQIKINLFNNYHYTGTITELTEHTLILKDKYNKKLPFSLKSIAYIDVVKQEWTRIGKQ